jgi:predicted transcriptional regulator
MKVRDILSAFNLELAAGAKGLDREVVDGYCGDLLSDVIANAKSGSVWLTVQAHQNILAVAVLKELAAIVLINGYHPDDATKAKAEEEGIPLLLSISTAYNLAGELFSAGIIRKSG